MKSARMPRQPEGPPSSDSFMDFVIGTTAGLSLLLAILFAAVLIVLGDTAVPALSVLFHVMGAS